jgi:glycerate dehydrogenase
MSLPRIVFLDGGTIGPAVELTRPAAAHDWQSHDRTAPEDVVARLAGATVAVVNKVPLRREALAQLPDLKCIVVAATGYDVIDAPYCRERGIIVSNVQGYAVNTLPEHTMALILALRRSLVGFREDVIAGAWQKSGQFCFFNHPIKDLSGSRIGIIGAGSLGGAVARLAEAFGMIPMISGRKGDDAPPPGRTPFAEVLATADILTLHCPLTPETRDLIAAPEFAAMTRRPIVINTARGGLVNEAALVDALEGGLISGAGIDVLTKEPPAPDNPLLRILSRPDVIVTPHVAWASDEAMQALWLQVIENIDGFLGGAPLRRVV